MEGEEVLQGRKLRVEDVKWLRGWIEANPEWSRKRIAQELCLHWDWWDGMGRMKDFAASSLLLKLGAQGWIKLPALQTHKRRAARRVSEPAEWEEPEVLACALARLGKIELVPVAAGSAAAGRWGFYRVASVSMRERVLGDHVGCTPDSNPGAQHEWQRILGDRPGGIAAASDRVAASPTRAVPHS